jgi:hypothetical protein
VLLDDTDDEEVLSAPLKKQKAISRNGKSYFDTEEDNSYIGDEESNFFMQKIKKQGAWTY